MFKDPVTGPRSVGKLNVEGDGQGDLAGDGGEARAVFVYQIDSYRHWERELGRDDPALSPGWQASFRALVAGTPNERSGGSIAGDVGYSPEPVEPPTEGSALICCSQPREDLFLDL